MQRQQLGQYIYLAVNTVNGSDVPTTPDAAPVLNIYAADETAVLSSYNMPPQDFTNKTLFAHDLFLGAGYSTGFYCAKIDYTISSTTYGVIIPFEVLAGGNIKGAYTAIQFVERPQADYIVGSTESGLIEARRKPRIDGDY